MKRARRTPLQALWSSVKVESCANGTMRVKAKWQPLYLPAGGVITRLYAARHLQRIINSHLKARGK